MSQQWVRLPERGNPLMLWLIRWIALYVGRPVGRALLYPITLYFLLTAPAARIAAVPAAGAGPRAGLARGFSPYPLLCGDHSGSGLFPDRAVTTV